MDKHQAQSFDRVWLALASGLVLLLTVLALTAALGTAAGGGTRP